MVVSLLTFPINWIAAPLMCSFKKKKNLMKSKHAWLVTEESKKACFALWHQLW